MVKSSSAFSPRRLSLNPPRPFKLPWHAPRLHPDRDSTGSTSLTNDTGSAVFAAAAHKSKASKAIRVGIGFNRE